MSSQYFSYSSRALPNMPVRRSATFLVMWALIFFTEPSFCRKERLTFRGMSGQSMTPRRSIRNSGMISLMLSATNTWPEKSLISPSRTPKSSGSLGKYRMPFRLKG